MCYIVYMIIKNLLSSCTLVQNKNRYVLYIEYWCTLMLFIESNAQILVVYDAQYRNPGTDYTFGSYITTPWLGWKTIQDLKFKEFQLIPKGKKNKFFSCIFPVK